MNISLECLRGQFKKKFGLELFNFSEEKKFELRYIKKRYNNPKNLGKT